MSRSPSWSISTTVDLYPRPGPRAVVDDVAPPFQPAFGLDSFIPIDPERFVGAFIVLVRVVALARYQYRLAIAFEVGDSQRVSLRPGVVDDVFYPGAVALRVLLLFVPENSVVVAEAW